MTTKMSTGDGSGGSSWRAVGRRLVWAWRWMLNALRGLGSTPEAVSPPPAPGRLSERRPLASPLAVPASGYIFHFNLHAVFVWVSHGVSREMLSTSIQYFMPYAVRELKAFAAGRARQHPPHHARELEVELQRDLADMGNWRYKRGEVEVTCRPYVWVQLDNRVKQAVQPYWEQLIKLDCEHDVQMKRAEYAKQLSQQWLTILTELAGSPLADGAAQMTEKEFAAVVEKIVAERKAAAAKLESLLEDRIREGDAFDRMEHFELLKERLERFATSAFAGSGGPSPNGAANSHPLS